MLKLPTHSGFHDLFLKYYTVRTDQKSKLKLVETEAKYIPHNTPIHDRALFWLAHNTPIDDRAPSWLDKGVSELLAKRKRTKRQTMVKIKRTKRKTIIKIKAID